MMENLFYIPETMIWPLLACLVLTGIHVYLGVHVIERKVIFVDLALAQIAALGTVIGVMMGYEVGKDVTELYLYSLAFTIFGAFIFSVTRMRGEKVPHEAIIGIVYAVTFAATILVLSRSALGPQELDHIIKGELLWVQPDVVIKTAIIYSIVGLFHFVFRRTFMVISFEPERAEQSGINVRFWDFLFYMSFGFVITSSVAIAGVFLVFSYLVIPAVGAMLLSEKLSTRLAIGWVGGSVISFIGVKLSWDTGLPTSPLIVCVLAVALILSGIVRYYRHASLKIAAVRNLVGSTAIVAVFVAGVFLFRKADEDPLEHALHLLSSSLSTDRLTGISQLGSFPEQKDQWMPGVLGRLRDDDAEVRRAAVSLIAQSGFREGMPQIMELLKDKSDAVKFAAVKAVKALGDEHTAAQIIELSKQEEDAEMRIEMLEAALELGNPNAIPLLIEMMRQNGLFADEAYHCLRAHVQFTFTREEPDKLENWWRKNRERLRWDAKSKMFSVSG